MKRLLASILMTTVLIETVAVPRALAIQSEQINETIFVQTHGENLCFGDEITSDPTTLLVPELVIEQLKNQVTSVSKKTVGSELLTANENQVLPEFQEEIVRGRTKQVISSFTDISTADWFYEQVQFVAEKGLMNGTGDGNFEPYASTTRGMIVTVLHSLAGYPEPTTTGGFDDVSSSDWYGNAVAWAKEVGITSGMTENTFDPNGFMTREQLVVMLYAYEKQFGDGGFTGLWAFPLDFTDNEKISEWATESTAWCVMNHIVGGRDTGEFDPQAIANRAEVATILKNFVAHTSDDTIPEINVPETSTELSAKIEQVEEAFSEGSLVKIEALLFGFQDLVIDESLEALLESNHTNESSTPLMASIFKETTVKSTSVEDEYVEFQVIAPNLTNIFENLQNDITEKEFSAYLLEYISTAEKQTTTVQLSYEIKNGNAIINFQEDEFVKAVTGGFFDAYTQLYQNAMDELWEGVFGT